MRLQTRQQLFALAFAGFVGFARQAAAASAVEAQAAAAAIPNLNEGYGYGGYASPYGISVDNGYGGNDHHSLRYGSDGDVVGALLEQKHPENSECEDCGPAGVCTLIRPMPSDVVNNTVEACHVYEITGSKEGGFPIDGEYHLQVPGHAHKGEHKLNLTENEDVAPFTFRRHDTLSQRGHNVSHEDLDHEHDAHNGEDLLLHWRGSGGSGEGGYWAIETANTNAETVNGEEGPTAAQVKDAVSNMLNGTTIPGSAWAGMEPIIVGSISAQAAYYAGIVVPLTTRYANTVVEVSQETGVVSMTVSCGPCRSSRISDEEKLAFETDVVCPGLYVINSCADEFDFVWSDGSIVVTATPSRKAGAAGPVAHAYTCAPPPICVLQDSDSCLQASPCWGASYSCNTYNPAHEYCTSNWIKDARRCCPVTCGTGPLTESDCNSLSGDGTCTYPNEAQCPSPKLGDGEGEGSYGSYGSDNPTCDDIDGEGTSFAACDAVGEFLNPNLASVMCGLYPGYQTGDPCGVKDCCLAECAAGTRVEANYLGRGSWFEASVSSVSGDTITVDWADKNAHGRQNPSAQVRTFSSAVVCEPESYVPVDACQRGGQEGGAGPSGSPWQEWDGRTKRFGPSELQVRCVQDKDAHKRKLHTVFSPDMEPTFECACFAGYSGSGVSMTSPFPSPSGNCLPVACPAESHGINVPSGCFCNPGFVGVVIATTEAPFYEGSCEPVECPRNSVGAMPFCKCAGGFHGRIAPTMTSPFFNGHCEVNKCVCEDGVAAKGGSWLQVDKANMPAQAGTGKCQAVPWHGVLSEGVPDACCEGEGKADCAVCNPHFRMEYDATLQRGKCVACPLATFNLATQFQPLHQVGVYAEAGRYYSVHSPHHRDQDTDDVSTCQLDRDDYCHAIKSDCDDKNCDILDSIRSQCWASAKCKWFSTEQICSLRDPCVRKMKRSCRKASHCSWKVDKGRCFEEDAILIEDELISSSKCDRKDMNGCITDFFCKWAKNGKGCGRHPCRYKNKDSCDEPQCQWNSQHTRCDTAGNSWSRSDEYISQTPTAAASPEMHNANWQWEHGEFVETDASLLDIPKHFRGTPLGEQWNSQ